MPTLESIDGLHDALGVEGIARVGGVLHDAVDPEGGLLAGFAELKQGLHRLAGDAAAAAPTAFTRRFASLSVGVGGGVGSGGDEAVDLVAEGEGDGFGGASADLGEGLEQSVVAVGDGRRKDAYVQRHRAKGLAVADAFDGDEEFEERPIVGRCEAGEAGEHGLALALGFVELEGVQRDRLAGAHGEPGREEGGQEHGVGEAGRGVGGDERGGVVDGFEGTGDAGDHGVGSLAAGRCGSCEGMPVPVDLEVMLSAMRYAVIIAGGAGTRLWPMSTTDLPKQLIPFINGRSLLQISMERLRGLLPDERILVCAGEAHREVMLDRLPGMTPERFIAEPVGRDTLNAVALASAVVESRDPGATVAIFTADHIIEPVDEFQRIVERGFELAESGESTLVTFGIEPTHAATGYGYLELGEAVDEESGRVVSRFKEKPEESLAERYFEAGSGKYLWNSGMFVWKASTLLACVRAFQPENADGIERVMSAWGDASRRDEVLGEVYPGLKKISVDHGVMEAASGDERFRVVAVPMPLSWLDVGSWPSFGETCEADADGNATSGCHHVLMDTRDTLVASDDPDHLITTIGVEGLIIIHTPEATLVCRADRAEDIKELHKAVGERVGEGFL